MNLLVLSLTCILDSCVVRFRAFRIFVAAALGAALEAGMLFLVPYAFAIVSVAVFVIPLMLLLSFGKENRKQMLFRTAVSWLSIVLLNGVATAVYNLTGISQLHLFSALVVLLVTVFLVQSTKAVVRQQKRMVLLVLKNGTNVIKTRGLYDSGNLLTLPQQEIPVHIAEPLLLQELTDANTHFETIPYRALGNPDGTLQVYRIQEMKILCENGQTKKISPVWLGKADYGLLEGKPYRIILHASTREAHAAEKVRKNRAS